LTIAMLLLLGILAFRPASRRAPDPEANASHFELVDDLNPRIIRSSHEDD
jgi:cbb3-type cytochrome oxidase subunit 3